MFHVFCVATILFLIVTTGVSAVPPNPWPEVHFHREIEFSVEDTTGAYVNNQGGQTYKNVFYNFPALQLKVSNNPVINVGAEDGQMTTFTSYWLNTTLYMYTEFLSPALQNLSTCTPLEMGFGMMVPDWMIRGATTLNYTIWGTRQSWPMDSNYYPLNLNRKDGAGFGYFEYYSDNRTGNPFRMDAPAGGQGVVVNEYASPIPFTTEPFPNGTFLPPCAVHEKPNRRERP